MLRVSRTIMKGGWAARSSLFGVWFCYLKHTPMTLCVHTLPSGFVLLQIIHIQSQLIAWRILYPVHLRMVPFRD